jgi:predicted nucleic acid-binding protein
VILVDSSVAVAAFASWHERHDSARRVVDGGARLVAHCALEAYSVLTRLPPPHRAPPELVRTWIDERFADPWPALVGRPFRAFLRSLPGLGIAGGPTYDALVAATAARARACLATCDRRAASVYERYPIEVRWV